jgi:DNA-binding LacI/PurR family transcriptional regulator
MIPSVGTDEGIDAWLRAITGRLPGLSGIVVMDLGSLDPLLRRLAAAGLDVPGAMSVLAVAPAEEFAHTFPRISVVDIPGKRMVELAVNRALDELAGAPRGVRELLAPVLEERGSTGPAPVRPARH